MVNKNSESRGDTSKENNHRKRYNFWECNLSLRRESKNKKTEKKKEKEKRERVCVNIAMAETGTSISTTRQKNMKISRICKCQIQFWIMGLKWVLLIEYIFRRTFLKTNRKKYYWSVGYQGVDCELQVSLQIWNTLWIQFFISLFSSHKFIRTRIIYLLIYVNKWLRC